MQHADDRQDSERGKVMLIVFVVVVAIAAVGGYIAGFVMGRDLKMHEAYRLYKKMYEDDSDD